MEYNIHKYFSISFQLSVTINDYAFLNSERALYIYKGVGPLPKAQNGQTFREHIVFGILTVAVKQVIIGTNVCWLTSLKMQTKNKEDSFIIYHRKIKMCECNHLEIWCVHLTATIHSNEYCTVKRQNENKTMVLRFCCIQDAYKLLNSSSQINPFNHTQHISYALRIWLDVLIWWKCHPLWIFAPKREQGVSSKARCKSWDMTKKQKQRTAAPLLTVQHSSQFYLT